MQPVTAPLTPLDEAEAVQETAQWLFPDAMNQFGPATATAAALIIWLRARSPDGRHLPVGTHSRAQNVRQDQGVAGVGLLTGDHVPVAVAQPLSFFQPQLAVVR